MINTAQKLMFSIKETANLVTFTKEIFDGKLNFLCSLISFSARYVLSRSVEKSKEGLFSCSCIVTYLSNDWRGFFPSINLGFWFQTLQISC